jgi:hypothetical protein
VEFYIRGQNQRKSRMQLESSYLIENTGKEFNKMDNELEERMDT